MSKAHRDQTRRAKIKGARPSAAQRAQPREPDQQAAWDEALNAFLPMTTTEQVQRRDAIRDDLRAKQQTMRDQPDRPTR